MTSGPGMEGWGDQGRASSASPVAAWPAPQQDTSHNWMGVVALISGIMGMIVFAYVFGFLGLNAARRGQADNKMMSIGGIAVASMYVIAVVIAIVLSETH